MNSSKLVEFIRTLDKGELRRFGDFLNSPFYNKDKRLLKIFNFLKKYHPLFESKALEKEQVFKKLFPKEQYSLSQQNKLLFNLSKLVEDFFTINQLERNPIQNQLLYLDALKEKRLDKHFFSAAEKLDKAQEKWKKEDCQSYFFRYSLHHLIYTHPSFEKSQSTVENFQIFNEHLDWFYMATKYKYLTSNKSLENQIKTAYEPLHISYFLGLTEKDLEKSPPLVKVMFALAQAYQKKPTESTFRQLKTILYQHIDALGKESKDAFQLLFNYALLAQFKEKHNTELLDLYKFALNKELIIEDGYMADVNFCNILILACKTNDIDWARQFVREYLQFIPPSSQQNVRIYAEAYLAYSTGEYEQAVQCVVQNDLELTQLNYKINARLIQVKSYYYLDDFDRLMRLFDSFNRLIRRNGLISKDQQHKYLNVINHLKKLYVDRHDKGKLKQIRAAVSQEENIASKAWLLEEIDKSLVGTYR